MIRVIVFFNIASFTLLFYDRELYRKCGAFSCLTLYFDAASVALHKSFANRHAQADAFGFGGEKGLKYFLYILFRDAFSGIGNRDGRPSWLLSFRFNHQLTTPGHGLDSVEYDIPENLIQLVRIGQDPG